MKERPILFSAPMVRAILEGRKTQTRRAIRKQFAPDAEPEEVAATSPEGWQISGHSGLWWDDAGACIDDAIRCPYGQPGDRLWVRETWRIGAWDESRGAVAIDYKADGYCRRDWIEIGYGDDGAEFEHYWIQCTDDADKAGIRLDENGEYKWEPGQSPCRYRPSIHMPRWASRILLEVTGVRIERLQDISDRGPANDCTAEGVFHCGIPVPTYEQWHGDGFRSSEKWMYRKLWDQINGAGSWLANPWVWVVEFKRVKP